MTGEQVPRRVYSAEELHLLRSSYSQPKLREAIEAHDGDDAELVKEHVLRGSRSFAARSFRSRTSGNSLRVPSNKENRSTADTENSRPSAAGNATTNRSVLGQITANGQVLRSVTTHADSSPTHSLKKRKAEAIVKAHGSPQHVRVTAGGRIVPSEQSPLCHPRYGYSAIKNNGGLIKFAPNHPMGKAQWTQATQNGFVAQDVNGRLCQIVNGTILPLNEVDGALRLYVPAPNLNVTSRTSSTQAANGRIGKNDNQRRAPSSGKPLVPADPPLPTQTNALELEYSKLEHELRELDKTEVLHGRTMGKAAKEALVSKRRELVINMDNIRKAIKSIKSIPMLDAPSSPRAMQNPQAASPTKNRLPAFLQHRVQHSNEASMPPRPPMYGPFFGMSQPQPYNTHFSLPAPDAMYNDPEYGMTQPPLYVPPPPFDGSMAPPLGTYHDPTTTNTISAQAMPTMTTTPPEVTNAETRLPQTDGAASVKELRRVASPTRSHAVDIKPPEPRSKMVKSNLNPMSPAYKPPNGVLHKAGYADQTITKPMEDRQPTPLSPQYHINNPADTSKTGNGTDGAISPSKKTNHLQSSSISSFETADFFPRNTRDYSTRKHAYPDPADQAEDKENISATRSVHAADGSPIDSSQAVDTKNTSSGGHNSPAPPPGTPVSQEATTQVPLCTGNVDKSADHGSRGFDGAAVPDRDTHNLSPKSRRQDYLFVYEDPRLLPSLPSSSPEKYQSCRGEYSSTPADAIDFSEASREWIEGYRAGLARKPVESDRAGDFLDGYCAGLLKSKPSKVGPSTGSPVKSVSRRPSPSVLQSRSSSRMQQLERCESATARSPFENNVHSMDTLKEAVFAPHNEDAILTPTADGPHANEPPFNLGEWEKSQEAAMSAESLVHTRGDGLSGFPFPYRTASMIRRQGVMSDDDAILKHHFQQPGTTSHTSMPRAAVASELSADETSHGVASLIGATRGLRLGTPKGPNNRVTSITSIDSNIHYQWPGPRVLGSQLGWRSASSLAQATGLASGFFANDRIEVGPKNEHPDSVAINPTIQTHSRFKEGSLAGITQPPNSPQGAHFVSPPMSPALSAIDQSGSPTKDKKKDSPGKGTSPSKIKFENLAEKVGIKVSTVGVGKKEGGSPDTPPGKRRWRDVWRGGSRKEPSKDDGDKSA